MKLTALIVMIACLAGVEIAAADIYVLRDPAGKIVLTNQGRKRGYEVVKRVREFEGNRTPGQRSGRVPLHAFRTRVPDHTYDPLVVRLAHRHGVDPHLVKGVIRAESSFDRRALSPAGAMGLMQLMPITARHWAVADPWDPEQNVEGGVKHLRYLLDRYRGKMDLALAAYNAGTVPVDAARGIPNYPETQEYVERVRHFYAHYRTRYLAPPPAAKRTAIDLAAAVAGRAPEELYGRELVLIDRRAEGEAAPPIETADAAVVLASR